MEKDLAKVPDVISRPRIYETHDILRSIQSCHDVENARSNE